MKATITLFSLVFFFIAFSNKTYAQLVPACNLQIESIENNPDVPGQFCEGSVTYTFTINCNVPFQNWTLVSPFMQSLDLSGIWISDNDTLVATFAAPGDTGVILQLFATVTNLDGFDFLQDTISISNLPTLGCSDIDFTIDQIQLATNIASSDGSVVFTIFTSSCFQGGWYARMRNLDTEEEFAQTSPSIQNTILQPNNTTIIIGSLPAGNYSVFVSTEACIYLEATASFSVEACAEEIMCNEIDDDCDGDIDEGFEDLLETFYVDYDGDLFGNAAFSQLACEIPVGFVSNNDDCDDEQSSTHPGATEIIGNLVDDNCNGEIDEGALLTRYYADYDFDGYGNPEIFIDVTTGTNPTNFVLLGTDCDDTNPDKHPEADQGVLEWTTNTLVSHSFDFPSLHFCTYGNNQSSAISDGSYLDFPRSYNCDEMFVTKLDPTGDVVWQSEVEFDMLPGHVTRAYYGSATIDGGGILAGTEVNLLNYQVGKAVKLDAFGNTQWEFQSDHSLNASGSTDLQFISETADGGFIATGVDQQFNFDVAPYIFGGVYIVKISAYGLKEWHKILAGYAPFRSIIQTSDGGYVAVEDGSAGVNFYSVGKRVIKFDGSGNIVWTKANFAARTPEELNTGGFNVTEETLQNGSIGIATDGNIVVGVDRSNVSEFNPNQINDIVLIKYDNNGNEIWKTVIEEGANTAGLLYRQIERTKNITFYETGNFLYDDYFNIIKFDTDGNNLGIFQIDSFNFYSATADGGVVTSFNNNPDATKIQKYSGKEVFDICDHVDNDCDGLVDEDVAIFTYYLDTDNDGYGSIETSVEDCEVPLLGYSRNAVDCNDHDFEVNPNAEEICNLIDDNCNGLIDDEVIDATITPAGSASACVGSAVLLSVPYAPGLLYVWKKNNVNIIGAIDHDYIATSNGNYKVTITAQVGGCKETSSIVKVTINPPPIADITALTDLNLCGANDRARLKATAGAGYTYAWLLNGFFAPNNFTGRTYSAKNPGVYTVVITNAQGCSTTSAPVTVAVGCKEGNAFDNNDISIYPNPTSQNFTIDLVLGNQINTTAQINIYNTTGQLICSQQRNVIDGILFEEINPENVLPNGIYSVSILIDGKIYQQSLIVLQ